MSWATCPDTTALDEAGFLTDRMEYDSRILSGYHAFFIFKDLLTKTLRGLSTLWQDPFDTWL